MIRVALLACIAVLASGCTRPDQERRAFERVKLESTSYREVAFDNDAQRLKLAGMLFVPAGDGPHPAAVIIQGAGTSRRDNGWYLALAKYLQDNGIVVLMPDKRGSGRSEGNWRTASFQDLATDTMAALEYLRRQQQVAVKGIGIVGLSQGGTLAPLVADRAGNNLDFVVSVVGGGVPMHDALLYEETHNLRQLGIWPGVSDVMAYFGAWSLRWFRQRDFWSAVGNFDPVPYWRKLPVPALALFGEIDTNVPTRESVEALRGLGKPNLEVKVYEGSGHALESPPGRGNSFFREDALRDIRDFIRGTLAGR
jgi:dienelactone hydrolase